MIEGLVILSIPVIIFCIFRYFSEDFIDALFGTLVFLFLLQLFVSIFEVDDSEQFYKTCIDEKNGIPAVMKFEKYKEYVCVKDNVIVYKQKVGEKANAERKQ